MNWIALLFLSVLTLQVLGKQENNRRQNLPQKTVRLDPLLRRALLRALSELEKEAQEKIKREEVQKLKSNVRIVGKRGNVQNPEREISEDEIQKTADTSYRTPNPLVNNPPETEYPQETTTTNEKDKTEPPFSVTVKDTFFFHTPSPIEQDVTSATHQETTRPESTLIPPEFENNLVSQVNVAERRPSHSTDKSEIETTTTFVSERITPKVTNKPPKSESEVELFKAPLVAAFTLHQDSKGVPKSVVPLLRHPQDLNKHKLLLQQQQLAQLKQQQQQLILQHQHQILQQRQNLASQQQPQQQFIPRVTITSLSQPNNFNQQKFFGSASQSTSFPSSTAFPPLASNSILPQNFQTSVIPAQGFHVSSTVTETRNNNHEFASTPSPIIPAQGFHVSSTVTESRNNNNEGFVSTPVPLRNFSPQSISSTLQPQSDFNKAIGVIPSHNFNFASTLQPNLPSPTSSPQTFQPINIPQVTLPLQNEQPRFSSQLGQVNQNQQFLERQKELDEQNRQRQIEELNRLRFAEEQKRQRQIIEQNRLKQLEDRRKKVSEGQVHQDGLDQFRQQREELGIDFLRSVGFTFDNTKQEFNKQFQPQQPQVTTQHKSPFNFNFQSSQTFGNTAFQDVESRNRVNRQEGFGTTGNFGFNRPVNQIPQFQKDVNQRNTQHNQVHFQQNVQHFPNFQQQQYRTIQEEHYRNFQTNRFQPFQQNNFQQRNNFQFVNRQPQLQQPTTESVNKQLEHLLLQSGLAAGHVGREEDLNIVSKVLALNHERADRDVQERSDKNIQETQSIRRSERRVRESSGKKLLVGEISEPSTNTKFSGR